MTTPPSPASRTRAGWMPMSARTLAAPPPAAPVVLAQGTGREINAGGMPGLIRVDPGWCRGALLVHEQVIPPGRLVRAHWHAEVAQWSLVTEGSLWFRVGAESYLVERGGYIWRPPGLVHAVWNAGPGPARQVEGNMRGDVMLRFYERFAELTADGPPDPEEITALAAAYGTHYDDPLTREIERSCHVSASLPAGSGRRP
jgi:uncharacterized cupin superfamily protein